jgi:hypothetical protein
MDYYFTWLANHSFVLLILIIILLGIGIYIANKKI